jgi:DNA invertase Pin-like site-specific DNA recombinase
MNICAQTVRKVTVIPPIAEMQGESRIDMRPKRVAAYCRVSTDREEQEHSFETQKAMYTEMIMMKPTWQMAGIYADEGITGTVAKKRPGFMKMIEDCRKGKIDMIVTKSVSRFSRNNLDCLMYVRELKQLGIPIIFEKEGINTIQVSSELLLTLFGALSQAESESISMNVKLGIRQSLKNGNVRFSYKTFLGYRKGADGQPEIVPEQADIVRRIYNDFLAGATYLEIAKRLTEENVPTMGGGNRWFSERIKSILKNEKYKGDALLQKTYITDPISKRVKKNNGELPMYYVENSHPAIIERRIFDKVQEEIARRAGKKKVKQTGTKTELGRYSGKYALTELLYCGECGTPYRRCTWSRNGKKKIVWRCVSRLDYGKKYCKNSPSVEESRLHNAIAAAITKKANSEEINIGGIMNHIESFGSQRDTDGIIQRQRRIAEIEKVIDDLARLNSDEAQSGELDYKFSELYAELYSVKDELEEMQSGASALDGDMLNEMREVVTGLKNHPVEYDDKVVRQLIDCIKVMSADMIKICFKDGTVTEVLM